MGSGKKMFNVGDQVAVHAQRGIIVAVYNDKYEVYFSDGECPSTLPASDITLIATASYTHQLQVGDKVDALSGPYVGGSRHHYTN